MRPRKHEEGLLVVTGKEEIEIPLKDMPHRVEVLFKKKHHPHPCNHDHHHSDKLRWEVVRFYRNHHYNYKLIIHWHVTDIREIVWVSHY